MHGRWEVIHHDPVVVLDVGHNIDGIQQIAEQLELTTYLQLHIVIGMVKDKEVEKVLALLPKHAAYYFTQAQIPRALDAESLQQKAFQLGLSGNHFPTVNIALNEAKQHTHKDDLILV